MGEAGGPARCWPKRPSGGGGKRVAAGGSACGNAVPAGPSPGWHSHERKNRCMQRSKLHVMGASGAGTTTLARALADHWAVPHADADDYFWVPSTPPYLEKRSEDERLELMRTVFVPREAWVLSGSMLGWGESIVAECDAVVFLTLDPHERLRRLEARETLRRAGRDFDHVAWAAFLDWARSYDDPSAGRSRVAHEAWLEGVTQPVLRLDSEQSREELRDMVLGWEPYA
jgi:hypothetical protein